MQLPKHPDTKKPLSQIETWAKERLGDILFSCLLNIKLKQTGICPKYFCEMDDKEFFQYTTLIEELLQQK